MQNLADTINNLLDIGDHTLAKQIILDKFETLVHLEGKNKILAESKLWGYMIDIAYESDNEEDMKLAISFFNDNQEVLCVLYSTSSFLYNLAIATEGISKASYKERQVPSFDIQKEKFQEPIQLYWSALNCLEDDEKLRFQILINLSNALVKVGRIVEAIQFLDSVIKNKPDFRQALISRADHLNFMIWTTNCAPSVALYVEIFNNYNDAISLGQLPPHILEKSIRKREYLMNKIKSEGFEIANIAAEIKETHLEFEQQSNYRKYCILNSLTINEHGIYCGCNANKKDDLQIGVPHGVFRSEVIPKMELLLNRLKSEFAFARWSYYNSISGEIFLEFDTQYSDLLENEIISPEIELQRSSFRICYGILDKIALGICKLYNLPSKRIYFETFWETPKILPLLNETRNLHLNALYSIACDLSSTTGELKHFKNWRNKLEHNLLIIKDTLTFDPDYLKVFEDTEFVDIVDSNIFKEKTLHLLQLTRAAIFSFVFCVRLETIERPTNDSDKNGISINLK